MAKSGLTSPWRTRRQPSTLRWMLLALVPAALLTMGTFAAVRVTTPTQSYFYAFFFERSWIQVASTFVFWLTIVELLRQHWALRHERRACDAAAAILSGSDFAAGGLIWADAERIKAKFDGTEVAAHATSLSFTRIINAVDRLRKTQNTGAMQEYCQNRNDADADALDTHYAMVRYLIWLIPTLGFIGTVMGIGLAISGFADAISKAQDFKAVQAVLPDVARYLGTAFDTTLLALGLAVFAVFYTSWLSKQQEGLLGDLHHLSIDALCAAFREHATASDQVVRAVFQAVDQISDRMNGNRAAIEQVVRAELPPLLAASLASAVAAGSGSVVSFGAELQHHRAEVARLLEVQANRVEAALSRRTAPTPGPVQSGGGGGPHGR